MQSLGRISVNYCESLNKREIHVCLGDCHPTQKNVSK